jgi:putative transposase
MERITQPMSNISIYNPVKHGLVKSPVDWAHSSFHRYAANGLFPINWGAGESMVFDGGVGCE